MMFILGDTENLCVNNGEKSGLFQLTKQKLFDKPSAVKRYCGFTEVNLEDKYWKTAAKETIKVPSDKHNISRKWK